MADDLRNTLNTDIGTTASPTGDPTEFEQYEVATWSIAGQTYAFPAQIIRDLGGNRIIKRERAYRHGAKLDNTGAVARVWQMECLFHNSIQEPGIAETNGADALYPTVLNKILETFNDMETGDLVVPTIGLVRAKLESYDRTETYEERDCASVTFVFVEDNEDEVDFASISFSPVDGVGRELAGQTTFDAQSADTWDQTFADIEASMNALEDLANSPASTVQDINRESDRLQRLILSADQKFRQVGRNGRDTLSNPRGNATRRKLDRQREVAARVTNDARRGRPQILRFLVGRQTSLFEVASFLDQPYRDLLAINTQLPDVLNIPAGTIVRVLSGVGRLQ